jgi:phosphohistidine swiveling domain-containing protein
MLDKLFNSAIRVKILSLFFKQEGQKLYIHEIIREAETDAANTHRELVKLYKLGILNSEVQGNQKYYSLNKNYQFYKGLKELFVHYTPEGEDPWLLAEDIPDMDLFFSDIWMTSFANEFERPSGRAYKRVLSIYRGYHQWYYFGENDSKQVADHIVNKFLKTPEFTVKVEKEIINWADKLKSFAKTLPEENLDKLTNQKIWSLYKKQDEIHTDYYRWGWIPVATDMFHPILTNKLQDHLRSLGVPEDKINEYFVTLTQSKQKSLIQIEREELLKIAFKISQDPEQRKIFWDLYHQFRDQEAAALRLQTHTKEYEARLEKKIETLIDDIKPEFMKQIQQHYLKYFYINHMWVGEVSSLEFYIKELVKLVGTDANIAEILEVEETEWLESNKRRDALLKELNLTSKWRTLFESFANFMVSKIYRRYAQIYAIYKMEFLQREIARRLGLTLKQVRFMRPEDIEKALIEGKYDPKELQERTQFCVYLIEKGKSTIYTGQQAEQLADQVQQVKVSQDITELTGQTGCIGKAIGTVKLITRAEEMVKMKQGDILVSISTDPDIVPAMKKAAAIVTEQGGVTSHAAIVSRELNIPCVIGTKIATKIFNDGDIVEVDANQGKVRLVKRA